MFALLSPLLLGRVSTRCKYFQCGGSCSPSLFCGRKLPEVEPRSFVLDVALEFPAVGLRPDHSTLRGAAMPVQPVRGAVNITKITDAVVVPDAVDVVNVTDWPLTVVVKPDYALRVVETPANTKPQVSMLVDAANGPRSRARLAGLVGQIASVWVVVKQFTNQRSVQLSWQRFLLWEFQRAVATKPPIVHLAIATMRDLAAPINRTHLGVGHADVA
jgi:hypothetical protein